MIVVVIQKYLIFFHKILRYKDNCRYELYKILPNKAKLRTLNWNLPHLNLEKIFIFSFPLFLIYLTDSTLGYILPLVIDNTVDSNTTVGVIIALSSIAGILCDLLFPVLFRSRTWRIQIILGIVTSILFGFFVYLGIQQSLILYFILASISWGIYYEFIGFGQQNFVVDEEHKSKFSRDWGIVFFIVNITTLIGPIFASLILLDSTSNSIFIITAIQLFSLILVFAMLLRFPHIKTLKRKPLILQSINLFRQIVFWKVYAKRILPVILLGIILEIFDAYFFIFGGLFGEKLSNSELYSWVPLVLYIAPSLLSNLLISQNPINKKKKKYSQIALLVSSLFFIPIFALANYPYMIFGLIFSGAFIMSFAPTLNEAVYSDLMHRSKLNRDELLGLAKANSSFAYIVGPLVFGVIADKFDYYLIFSLLGVIGVVIAISLLFITPRKIKLPQKELRSMNEID